MILSEFTETYVKRIALDGRSNQKEAQYSFLRKQSGQKGGLDIPPMLQLTHIHHLRPFKDKKDFGI